MKIQILTLSAIICFSHYSNAQNPSPNSNANTQWKINGNNASSTDFMGTTNSQSLIFKTDNVARLQLDVQGKLILNSGKEMIINPIGLIRPEKTNPISAYMLKVGGSGHFDGELDTRQLFVQEYITYMKSLKGPRMDVDTIRMDSTRGIFGNTKIFGDVQIKQNLEVLGDAKFKGNLIAEKGFTFDGINGVKFTANANGGGSFNYGKNITARVATACAALPYGLTNHSFNGWMQIFDDTNPATTGLLNFMTFGTKSFIDASDYGNTGGGSALLLNYFCGNDVSICQGANGGIVQMGNKVTASQSMKIGSDGTGNVDLNSALTIHQNATGSNALKFNTYNNGLKVISIENVNFTNSPFTVYGDGRTEIATSATDAFQIIDASNIVNFKVKHTGANGSIVSMGKVVEMGFATTDLNTNLNIKTTNGTNTKAISIKNSVDNEVFYIGADGRTIINTQTIPSGGSGSGLIINQNGTQASIGLDVKLTGSNIYSINTNLTLKNDNQTAIKVVNEAYATGVNTRFQVMGNGATYIGEKKAFGNHAGALLSVDGKALFKSIYVSTSGAVWADYVFEKDYKLMPLNELEAFYKKNKHLPEIPSAKDVEKEMIDVAKMESILLKKVEELTLYIVQLEKDIKSIKENNKH